MQYVIFSSLFKFTTMDNVCDIFLFMMTSSNGNISPLLVLCEGNSTVTGEFPSQRPVTRSFEVFFDLHLNKWLNNPSRRRWFETPSCSLWRHCNVLDKKFEIEKITISYGESFSVRLYALALFQYKTVCIAIRIPVITVRLLNLF